MSISRKAFYLFVSFLIIIIAGLIVMFSGIFQKPEETPIASEDQPLVEEARAVIEKFNQIYIVKTEEEFKTIIQDTWLNADDVMETMLDLFNEVKESGYVELDIRFSDEAIERAESGDAFMYTSTIQLKITKEDGMFDEYELEAEYYFKKASDGSYKLEEIKTINRSTMPL